MKDLYEVGIVFRGFIILNHQFVLMPGDDKKDWGTSRDLRGPFISAINTFAETAFSNCPLEYIESGSFLFVFKIGRIKSSDSPSEESFIIYGLFEKKKNSEKVVKKFLEMLKPIVKQFIDSFSNTDLSQIDEKLNQFKYDVIGHFI